MDKLTRQAIELLTPWAQASERWWYDLPGRPGLGCYGTGYNSWGVQTNQKYAAAMAMLAAHRLAKPSGGGAAGGGDEIADLALRRSLAAYRYSLATHHSGGLKATDGQTWGHTWISSLGIERMMHGLAAIDGHLTDDDRAAVRRVLTSEARWIYEHHHRGPHVGVFGDVWGRGGLNVPESNLWNGAVLWRTAAMYPDEPDAEAWRERAHEFLINSVSVAADAEDDRVVAGRPIRERFRGANFFPNYALDHHGYLNVGYMAICVSNAAMLHFDLRRLGLERPESLDHHEADLWRVLRRMIFADGRLARIGGDSRVRYAYCQEYLLPALLYAADHLGDEHALGLVDRQLDLMRHEADHGGDGSFYGKRLAPLAESNPYYFTRLESDRGNALGMLLAYLPLVKREPAEPTESFEASVAGVWHEPAHGSIMHRGESRLASFAWRAHGLTQGMCQPPDDGAMAEWSHNLAGEVRMVGDDGVILAAHDPHRRLLAHHSQTFDGGFVTCGSVMEGVTIAIPEGWSGTDSAVHHVAFAALPDGHSVVGLEYCVAADRRVYTARVSGMQWNLPNDLYNGFARRIASAGGERVLTSPPTGDQVLTLDSRWVSVLDQRGAGRVGAVGVYGAESLTIDRSAMRRGGRHESLFVERICWRLDDRVRSWDAGSVILDVGWVALSSVDADATARLAQPDQCRQLEMSHPLARGIEVAGRDGKRYAVLANFAAEPVDVAWGRGPGATLPPGTARVEQVG